MSVPKSKRGKSQLEIVTKSNELATYTIHICKQKKNHPGKRARRNCHNLILIMDKYYKGLWR